MKKFNFAFTLAEVLITLGIIGVVVAMTLPSVVGRYKEKETASKLKKVYSTISQAMNLAINEYGTIDKWDLPPTLTSDKNENGQTILDQTGQNILTERFLQYLNGDLLKAGWDEGVVLTNMQRVPLEMIYDKGEPRSIQLHDGTILIMGQIYGNDSCARSDITKGDLCSTIVVWFPPKNRQRNEGINQFNFYVMKDRLIPWGVPTDQNNPFERNCKISTNNRQSGRGCTAWVLEKENMSYLRCKDLS